MSHFLEDELNGPDNTEFMPEGCSQANPRAKKDKSILLRVNQYDIDIMDNLVEITGAGMRSTVIRQALTEYAKLKGVY